MSNRRFIGLCLVIPASAFLLTVVRPSPIAAAPGSDPTDLSFRNATGRARTFTASGALDLQNPFFQDLGTNGRRCVTCHQADQGWSITPQGVQARFAASAGTDPIFRNNDGSNCEGALHNTLDEERNNYSLLLTRGLIRVGLDVPQGADFAIDSVKDPYSCTPPTNDLSVYRRPLPSTNLRFLTAVMWDGRESSPSTTILDDLARQSNDATRGHAQGFRDLTAAERQQIVAFETGLFTAQAFDDAAAALDSQGATGAPEALASQSFFIGINDPVGLNPTGVRFEPRAFTLFNAWNTLSGSLQRSVKDARSAVARGQALFNTKSITLSGIAGLNNQTFSNGVTLPPSFEGTCTVCHDSPNVGNHSVKAPLDIGLSQPSVATYLPVYRLRNLTTQATIDTTDPGRALITGRWADVNKFKGPILRALASRAPYFHNGSAGTLRDVVEFYDTRFSIGFTAQEKADLVAFLRSL
jgi:cytochrome c peroxidase